MAWYSKVEYRGVRDEILKRAGHSGQILRKVDYHPFHVQKEQQLNLKDYQIRNRGNVFVVDNFVGASADAKKQFVNTAAHNIVGEMTNLEQGLDCECKLVNPYSARNVCKEAYSKEK